MGPGRVELMIYRVYCVARRKDYFCCFLVLQGLGWCGTAGAPHRLTVPLPCFFFDLFWLWVLVVEGWGGNEGPHSNLTLPFALFCLVCFGLGRFFFAICGGCKSPPPNRMTPKIYKKVNAKERTTHHQPIPSQTRKAGRNTQFLPQSFFAFVLFHCPSLILPVFSCFYLLLYLQKPSCWARQHFSQQRENERKKQKKPTKK